jgi:hypothetical protein
MTEAALILTAISSASSRRISMRWKVKIAGGDWQQGGFRYGF